jgi:hypothetical protein
MVRMRFPDLLLPNYLPNGYSRRWVVVEPFGTYLFDLEIACEGPSCYIVVFFDV